MPEAFPAEVLAEAERAATEPRLPGIDRTDVPFVTIDPPTSLDLDQALHLERLGDGFRVRYAIADVGAFVEPGGVVDAEAHRRGETAYSPDMRSPLYPPALSEGAASLLPEGPRPAVVWRLDIDAAGDLVETHVERAMVASRAKLSYADVQRSLDDGTADGALALLPQIGGVLQRAERARGGASLGVPRQEVVPSGEGYALRFEAPLAVEGWNAQLSLLTGRAAAQLMVAGGVGVLRTMPPPDPRDEARLRRMARALHVEWPDDMRYGDLLHTVDAHAPRPRRSSCRKRRCCSGARRTRRSTARCRSSPTHAAIAARYAHCTAPLRRLVDRYALETCLALCEDRRYRDGCSRRCPRFRARWLRRPTVTTASSERSSTRWRPPCWRPSVGQVSDALVIDLWKRGRGEVALRDAAVIGPCDDVHELAAEVRVRLEEADVSTRTIRFSRVGSNEP